MCDREAFDERVVRVAQVAETRASLPAVNPPSPTQAQKMWVVIPRVHIPRHRVPPDCGDRDDCEQCAALDVHRCVPVVHARDV